MRPLLRVSGPHLRLQAFLQTRWWLAEFSLTPPPSTESLRSPLSCWLSWGSILRSWRPPHCSLRAVWPSLHHALVLLQGQSRCWIHEHELTNEGTARRPSPCMCVPRWELKEALG